MKKYPVNPENPVNPDSDIFFPLAKVGTHFFASRLPEWESIFCFPLARVEKQ
jgi:hypothetical protein